MADQDHSMQRIITKCWDDDAFRARLQADPAATLAEEGVRVPEGMTVHVAFDTTDERTLVIPIAPPELTEEELEAFVSGGSLASRNRPMNEAYCEPANDKLNFYFSLGM